MCLPVAQIKMSDPAYEHSESIDYLIAKPHPLLYTFGVLAITFSTWTQIACQMHSQENNHFRTFTNGK